MIRRHPPLGAEVTEQPGRHPAVFHGNQIGVQEYFSRARGKIAEIADRGRNDIEAGRKNRVHREESWQRAH